MAKGLQPGAPAQRPGVPDPRGVHFNPGTHIMIGPKEGADHTPRRLTRQLSQKERKVQITWCALNSWHGRIHLLFWKRVAPAHTDRLARISQRVSQNSNRLKVNKLQSFERLES